MNKRGLILKIRGFPKQWILGKSSKITHSPSVCVYVWAVGRFHIFSPNQLFHGKIYQFYLHTHDLPTVHYISMSKPYIMCWNCWERCCTFYAKWFFNLRFWIEINHQNVSSPPKLFAYEFSLHARANEQTRNQMSKLVFK